MTLARDREEKSTGRFWHPNWHVEGLRHLQQHWFQQWKDRCLGAMARVFWQQEGRCQFKGSNPIGDHRVRESESSMCNASSDMTGMLVWRILRKGISHGGCLQILLRHQMKSFNPLPLTIPLLSHQKSDNAPEMRVMGGGSCTIAIPGAAPVLRASSRV